MRVCSFAERLQQLMDYFGITRVEFLKRTGLDKSTLSLYMSGKRDARQDKVSLIADTYGVNPAWLMGYDVPMIRVENPDLQIMENSSETEIELIKTTALLPTGEKARVLEYAQLLLLRERRGDDM